MSEDEFVAVSTAELVCRYRMRVFDYADISRKAVTRDLGRNPICRSGCSWCCYAKIVMDAGHGAMIALYLVQEGLWTAALEARLAAADTAMFRIDHGAWLRSLTPCVFLDAKEPGKGTCSVYPVRPIGCSGTLSSALDPRDCAVDGGRVLAQLDPSPGLLLHMIELPEAVLNAAGETSTALMTLPGAVLYGHALVTGGPRPDVFQIRKEDWDALPEPRPDIGPYFDHAAAAYFAKARP